MSCGLVLMLSIASYSYREYNLADTSLFEKVAMEIFSPIQGGTQKMKFHLSSFWDNYVNIVNTSKENEVLKAKVDDLSGQLFDMNQLIKENVRLKQLLEFGVEQSSKKILAQVIGWDTSKGFNVFRINKGTNQGINENDSVITSGGLVGFIYRASFGYADVLTILDTNNKIDVLNSRTRVYGILEGTGSENLIMKYVLKKSDIEIGDEVITAGLGKIYPKGIKVGEIIKVENDASNLTQYIEVLPSVDFSKLEEVVVLVKEDVDKEDPVESEGN